MKNNIFRIAAATALILSIPLIFQWPWTLSDFIVMGVMIFTTGSMVYLVMTKMGKHRIIAAGVIVFLFLWLWAELAVGLFTNWGN